MVIPASAGDVDIDDAGRAIPVADWTTAETLHCNKCGHNFEQLYAMRFDGQQLEGWRRYLEPVSEANEIRDRVEPLIAAVESFLEYLDGVADIPDDLAATEDVLREDKRVCQELADDDAVKKIRQRLLELKPYL